ncbi:MAG: prephenate dehydrogenase [Candidatus Altiarchaeota archaeon]|nr:prephenate dehydrogenase [Candidatus Altiarchaeota archaeon]
MKAKNDPVIAIIGGYGGMGRFFAEIFAKEGFTVLITGPSESSGREAARKLSVEYLKDNKKAAAKADVVIVSVPINATLDVIREVAPCVKKGGLLMDVTSVKERPCQYMKKYAPKDVEVLGTHPIFSHRVGSLDGQVFVLTPVRGERWLAWLKALLEDHNARVIESTPREHDQVMAVVQGLTHYAYISVGKTLQKLDFDIKESRTFASPIYELMLDMIGRIIGQKPELYASIQMQNPEVLKVHKVFLKTASELSDSVKKKDEKRFVEIMKAAAKHFDDLERAMGRSDKAIYSIVSELDTLKNSVGKELCLRHIYSGRIHLGVVEAVTAETVTLNERGKRFRLKISKIRILTGQERIRSRIDAYGTVSRDYSVVLEERVEERFILGLLCGFETNIVEGDVKDVYRGTKIGQGRKSVCFGLKLVDAGVKETEERINEFFRSIGGSLR